MAKAKKAQKRTSNRKPGRGEDEKSGSLDSVSLPSAEDEMLEEALAEDDGPVPSRRGRRRRDEVDDDLPPDDEEIEEAANLDADQFAAELE